MGEEYDYTYEGFYPEDGGGDSNQPPPEIAPVVETPTNEYTGGEYDLGEQLSKSIAKEGVGIDLNSLASGIGDMASGAAGITSSVVSGVVDIASSVTSGAVSVASEVASGVVKLTMETAAASAKKSGDLNKYSKDNPLPGDTKISLDSSEGEDLNGYSKDTGTERMDAALENFQGDKWSELSLEEQKQSMTNLADYVANSTGNKNPPEIVFRDDMNDGEYGGYDPNSNTLEINQNMLDDSNEAADTVAHEMWHAYQQQCASDPTSERGREYQEGFDNYISPEYDFEGYENQMVEAEAREYAQGFKNRLAGIQGA